MATCWGGLQTCVRSVVVIFAVTASALCDERLDTRTPARGFSAQCYVDKEGGEHRYVLFLPYSWQSGKKLPVLMFLNGVGENGRDGVRQISNNFGLQVWEMQEHFPFLIVAPQCGTNSSWSGANNDSRAAMEILDLVVNKFGADKDRICLTGVSAGGSGVWNIASAYPEWFAAIAPLCGNGGNAKQITKARLPVWNFINEGDAEALVSDSRRMRGELIKQGQSPLFTEFQAEGHDCWSATYRMPALYAWLLEQRKSSNTVEPLFQQLAVENVLSKWRIEGGAKWSKVAPDTLTSSSGIHEGLIVSNQVGFDQEFHADVWLEAGRACELALIPEPDAAQLDALRIKFTPLSAGRGGVFQQSGGESLCQMDMAALRSFAARRWNDIRVRLVQGQLTVKINGWMAADIPVSFASKDPGRRAQFRFAFVSPPGEHQCRWKDIRFRSL